MLDEKELPPCLKLPRSHGLPLCPPEPPLDVRLIRRASIVISDAELVGLFVFAFAAGVILGYWLAF